MNLAEAITRGRADCLELERLLMEFGNRQDCPDDPGLRRQIQNLSLRIARWSNAALYADAGADAKDGDA